MPALLLCVQKSNSPANKCITLHIGTEGVNELLLAIVRMVIPVYAGLVYVTFRDD